MLHVFSAEAPKFRIFKYILVVADWWHTISCGLPEWQGVPGKCLSTWVPEYLRTATAGTAKDAKSAKGNGQGERLREKANRDSQPKRRT